MFSSKKRSDRGSKSAIQSVGSKGTASYHAVIQRAMTEPGSLTAKDVHILQRALGNSATVSLLSQNTSASPVSVQRAPGIFKRKKKAKTPTISAPANATNSSGHDQVMQMLQMATPQELLALSQNTGFMEKVNQLPEDQLVQAQSFLNSLHISVPPAVTSYFAQKYPQRVFTSGAQGVARELGRGALDPSFLVKHGISEQSAADYIAGNDSAFSGIQHPELLQRPLNVMRQHIKDFQQKTMLPLDREDIEMLLFLRRANKPSPQKKPFSLFTRQQQTVDDNA